MQLCKYGALLVVGLVSPSIPIAAVFKCVAADGSVTFQQTACSGSDEETVVEVKDANSFSSEGSLEALAIVETSRAIAKGIVRVGMTKVEVISAWGSPTRTDTEQSSQKGTVVTIEFWEWDAKKEEKVTSRNCQSVSRASVPSKVERHIPKGATGLRSCRPETTTYTSVETKYVTFMNGVVTHVQS